MKRVCTLLLAALTLALAARAEEVGGLPAGPRLTGFVDASYAGNLQTGGDGFHLNQAELDIEHRLPDGLALRVDLESQGDTALALEQGWLALPLPFLRTWRLTVGKFNAPIGLELLDAPDLSFHSHALVFDYGLPVNLTGALVEGPLAGPASLKVYGVNGWDVNRETNASRSLGARLGLDLGAAGGLGLSLLTGREQAVKTSGAEDLGVIDLDYLIQVMERLTLGAELNLGQDQPDSAATKSWSGWMLSGRWALSETWTFALRIEQLADPDGLLFGHPAGETRSSASLACAWTPARGRRVLLEARLDHSDEQVFPDGEGALSTSTGSLALAFTQSF